jgi:hypothetical protein
VILCPLLITSLDGSLVVTFKCVIGSGKSLSLAERIVHLLAYTRYKSSIFFFFFFSILLLQFLIWCKQYVLQNSSVFLKNLAKQLNLGDLCEGLNLMPKLVYEKKVYHMHQKFRLSLYLGYELIYRLNDKQPYC